MPGFARVRAPVMVGSALLALTLAVRLHDPHVSGSWGYCPFQLTTGLPCPACGGLRAVNDLTRGDLVGAVSSNLAAVALLPLAVLWWVGWLRRSWRSVDGADAPAVPRLAVWVAAALVAVFTVIRWLPFGAWLAP